MSALRGENTMNDGLALAFKQSTDYLDRLWNFYGVVALGIVGLAYGGVKFGRADRARWPLTAGFIVWAIANLEALARQLKVRLVLVASLNEASKAASTPRVLVPFLATVHVTSLPALVVLHTTLDIIVLSAIWWPTLARARAKKRAPRHSEAEMQI